MGKKKKTSDKVKIFYRGPASGSIQVADESGMKIITDSIQVFINNRCNDFLIKNWLGQEKTLRPVLGLSSSLRCLKQGRTKAIIYDNTAADHVTNYLHHFANKNFIPILQANRLIDRIPKFGFKTLLIVSLVDSNHDRPVIQSDSVDLLCEYICNNNNLNRSEVLKFKPPKIDKVICSNQSQIKKQKRKSNLAKTKKRKT